MGIKLEISVAWLEICVKSGFRLVPRVLHGEEDSGSHPFIPQVKNGFNFWELVHPMGPQ